MSRLALGILCVLSGSSLLPADPEFGRDVRPLLSKYCFACHGEKKQEAGISLNELHSNEDAFRHHRLLRQLVSQVSSDEMPPFEAKVELTDSDREKLLFSLHHLINRVDQGEVPRNSGRVTLRRLNRNEYHYTVRDLFGITFNPGRDFPADGSGGEGFNNAADALFLPPSLMEKYLAAANQIVEAIYQDENLRKRYLFAQPDANADPLSIAKTILREHGRRVFRRHLTKQDLALLLKAVEKAMATGRSFEEAMRLPLTALLIHPSFLYRFEHDVPGKKEWPLKGEEIATRLSYFLWSSAPDDELLRLGGTNELAEPKVLRQQVKRMLNDPRALALSKHFAGQWLGFDALQERVIPDKERFPQFTPSLRRAMSQEAEQFFHHILTSNQPLTELIAARYSFLNKELAKHYGIEGVTGSKLQRVSLTDRNRGGILGLGAIHTTTSLPLRTSPVKRGVWVLEAILGEPPPPPPPDAGELPDDDKSTEGLSLRQQLEAHRKRAKCANCHNRIDPLGLGLENFDAIGRWRSHGVNGEAIDSRAKLPSGESFSSPAELKAVLLKDQDKFARNVARKMLAYALGRSLEYYDVPTINKLVADLKAENYRIETLIQGIVQSDPFLKRSAKR